MRWLCCAARRTERLQTHWGRGRAVMFSTFFFLQLLHFNHVFSLSPCQMDYVHISEVDVLFLSTFGSHEILVLSPEWEKHHKWEYFINKKPPMQHSVGLLRGTTFFTVSLKHTAKKCWCCFCYFCVINPPICSTRHNFTSEDLSLRPL